ncbi:MAG: hypothetical protein RLZZ127_404 [Planctomycetota bacterium]|jgi:hypothetical protein
MSRRVTALTDRLIRLEWHPEGRFDDRPSFIASEPRRPGLAMTVAEVDGWRTHRIGAVEVRLRGDGPFTADTCEARFPVSGRGGSWRPGQEPVGALGGTTRTLDGTAGDPPVQPGLLSLDGWAVVDDSRSVRLDPDGWVAPAADAGQDLYLFLHGHDFAAALQDFTGIAGRAPLPPRAVLGLWWSRYWRYSAADLQGIIGEFRAHGFPLDVLVMDMDWHQAKHWTGYTWNRDLFPDPAGFLGWCHGEGLLTTLNLHPHGGVMAFEAGYREFAAALGHPADGSAVPFRCSDRRFMDAYFRRLHHPREAEGVDFWWMDWQQGTRTEMPGLDALPWLNHLHHHDRARDGRRGVMLSRWGGLGGHRHPIQFSGDTHTTWETLASQVDFTAGSVASLAGWWSHDIGGHLQAPSPELFTRWFQWGCWSPALRLHSGNKPDQERRPWAYGEAVREACRAGVAMRCRYLPEWVAAAHRFHATGIAPLRPLWFDAPGDAQAQAARGQALLGDHLLIAPIVAAMQDGVAERQVVLPAAAGWWDLQTGERHAPGVATVRGGLDRIPVFARAGAVLGIAPYDRRGIAALDPARLDAELWPGDGAGEIVEDAGEGDGWTRGEVARTAIRQAWTGDDAVVTVEPTRGGFPGLPAVRPLTLIVRGCGRPRSVEGAAWAWTAAGLELRLRTGATAQTIRIAGAAVAPVRPVALGAAPATVVAARHDRRQARQRLLDLILTPPAGGGRAVVAWTRDQGSVERIEQDLGLLTGPTVAPCPLAWDAARGACRWQAEVAWTWPGGSRCDRAASAWDLYCGLGEWLVSVTGQALPDPSLLTPAAPPAGGDAWQVQSYSALRHESLLDGPRLWCDSDLGRRIGNGEAEGRWNPDGTPIVVDPAALVPVHLAALTDLVVERPLRLALMVQGLCAGVRIAVDGVAQPIGADRRTAPIDLAPGRRRVAVAMDGVDVPRAVRYLRALTVIAFAEDGRPLTGLGSVAPGI